MVLMKRRLGISAYYKVRMIVWEKCGKDFGFDLIYYKKPKWIWTESGHYQGINVKGAEKEIFFEIVIFLNSNENTNVHVSVIMNFSVFDIPRSIGKKAGISK